MKSRELSPVEPLGHASTALATLGTVQPAALEVLWAVDPSISLSIYYMCRTFSGSLSHVLTHLEVVINIW